MLGDDDDDDTRASILDAASAVGMGKTPSSDSAVFIVDDDVKEATIGSVFGSDTILNGPCLIVERC